MKTTRTLLAIAVALSIAPAAQTKPASGMYFQRLAYMEAVRNAPADRKKDAKSVAEIIAASEDGMLLAYVGGD